MVLLVSMCGGQEGGYLSFDRGIVEDAGADESRGEDYGGVKGS